MFYETSFISNLLKCHHCGQPYDQYYKPRMLSCCGDSICDTCVESLEKNSVDKKYKCVLCPKFGFVPDDGFPINQLAVKLVSQRPKEAYRGKEHRDLKTNINGLEQLSKKLLLESEHFNESNFNKHWDEQNEHIQITFDYLIQELTRQKEALMIRVNELRMTCKDNFTDMSQNVSMQAKEIVNKVNNFIDEQRTFMNQIQIDDRQIADSNERVAALRIEVENEHANLANEKNKIQEKSLVKFKSRETSIVEILIKDLLGYFDFESINKPTKSVNYFFFKYKCR